MRLLLLLICVASTATLATSTTTTNSNYQVSNTLGVYDRIDQLLGDFASGQVVAIKGYNGGYLKAVVDNNVDPLVALSVEAKNNNLDGDNNGYVDNAALWKLKEKVNYDNGKTTFKVRNMEYDCFLAVNPNDDSVWCGYSSNTVTAERLFDITVDSDTVTVGGTTVSVGKYTTIKPVDNGIDCM